MDKITPDISNKTVAYSGAMVAVAAVFGYAMIVLAYAIIRSSVTIFGIMPMGEKKSILLISAFSVAYSVTVFSLIMALISSIAGAITGVVLKRLMLGFNPKFNLEKAVFISAITAFTLLILLYYLFYASLKDWMTLNYAETFSFWFIFPACIFFTVCIISGCKLNKILKIISAE